MSQDGASIFTSLSKTLASYVLAEAVESPSYHWHPAAGILRLAAFGIEDHWESNLLLNIRA